VEFRLEAILKKSIVSALLLVSFLAILAVSGCGRYREPGPNIDANQYSAVLLDNNQVYFGKLDQAGSRYPVLTDVYYIQSQVNQDTKAVTNILVRRGNEWHGPDRMILNAHHILLIEPVGPKSKVAELIEADKNKK
jgi:hypothetical protein